MDTRENFCLDHLDARTQYHYFSWKYKQTPLRRKRGASDQLYKNLEDGKETVLYQAATAKTNEKNTSLTQDDTPARHHWYKNTILKSYASQNFLTHAFIGPPKKNHISKGIAMSPETKPGKVHTSPSTHFNNSSLSQTRPQP